MPPEPAAFQNTARPPCILLVEDEVIIRANMAEACRDRNITVVEAANAEEAWEFIATGGHPDIVFTDVAMPGKLDGLELCSRIQKRDPSIKLFITSGNLGPGRAPTGISFFQKPYQIAAVLNAIMDYLEKQRSRNDG